MFYLAVPLFTHTIESCYVVLVMTIFVLIKMFAVIITADSSRLVTRQEFFSLRLDYGTLQP